MAVGSRLIVRSRKDWRFAAISKRSEDKTVLTVCSPNGRTYRLRRESGSTVSMHGVIPVLVSELGDDWRENFSSYDLRW